MPHVHARRLFAALGAAAALVAAAAGPAAAAPGDPQLGLYAIDTTLAVGTAGAVFEPLVFSSASIVVRQPTFTFDFEGAEGVAVPVLDPEDDTCKASGHKVTCTHEQELEFSAGVTGTFFELAVKAAPGAEPGARGAIVVTFSGANIKRVTSTAKVRTAEAVDLTAGPRAELKVAPGAAFTGSTTVRNTGAKTVTGAGVLFFHDLSLGAGRKFSNCTYTGDELRSCTFDQELAAGSAYRLDVPYRLRADTYAPGFDAGELQWLTAAEMEDFTRFAGAGGWDLGRPGEGGVLTLAEAGTKALAVPRADQNPEDNWSGVAVTVTGTNGANLAAIGDTVTGAAGDVVTATVGVVNEGPAVIDWSRSTETIAWTSVAVPAGTTAVAVPAECLPDTGSDDDWDNAGEPGKKAYVCPNTKDIIGVDEPVTYAFTLRIDTVVPDATGVVAVNRPCQCSQFDKDTDPSDNTAALVVNPDGGGQGAGLPVTGPMGAVIAGAGLLLLVAGGAGVLITRRRRTRFVA